MGLDWMLHTHAPKQGREQDFTRIKQKLEQLDFDDSLTAEQRTNLRRDLEQALEQVAVTPYAVIQAPRVGLDDEATEWFRVNAYLPAQARVAEQLQLPAPNDAAPEWNQRDETFISYWSRSFEAVLAANHGKYVVALARDQEGFAAVSGMLTSAFDFRGKVVGNAECLDDVLRNEAYDDHDADAAADYAERLEAALHDVPDKHVHELVDLRAAIKWLRYWSAKGFGFTAWF